MSLPADFCDKIFSIRNNEDFENLALEAFHFQANQNQVYKEYLHHLHIDKRSVGKVEDIPFLPIEFFKTHQVISENQKSETIFESSGTTGSSVSRHFVVDLKLYEKSFLETFRIFYGDPADYTILALLPSYLERQHSSIVYMAQKLIELSNDPDSGFFLNNLKILSDLLQKKQEGQKKTLLLGVSFALLDLAAEYPQPLPDVIIMETGGMKGRKKEMIREELHQKLIDAFKVRDIHSEYGMTELLSQAYSQGLGIFRSPPWMKIIIREVNDPFGNVGRGVTGVINVIDLANIHSCCFIATQDLGKMANDDTFSVLGRMDNSDVRGCNLMI